MTTNFLKPVKVPGVVVVRSRVVKKAGRKIWARGTVEDGEGECWGVVLAMSVEARRKTNREPGNVLTECEAMLVDQTGGARTQL
jgi:hypothetical protein